MGSDQKHVSTNVLRASRAKLVAVIAVGLVIAWLIVPPALYYFLIPVTIPLLVVLVVIGVSAWKRAGRPADGPEA
jgi:hypothetical protein